MYGQAIPLPYKSQTNHHNRCPYISCVFLHFNTWSLAKTSKSVKRKPKGGATIISKLHEMRMTWISAWEEIVRSQCTGCLPDLANLTTSPPSSLPLMSRMKITHDLERKRISHSPSSASQSANSYVARSPRGQTTHTTYQTLTQLPTTTTSLLQSPICVTSR